MFAHVSDERYRITREAYTKKTATERKIYEFVLP